MTRSGTRPRSREEAALPHEDGSATYYEYDKIYQLTGETQADGQGQVAYAFEYQYDKAHNGTVKVDNGTPTYYTHNEANELLTETTNGETTYYQYDRCGNTTAKQKPAATTYYQYGTENLLTRTDFGDGGPGLRCHPRSARRRCAYRHQPPPPLGR
jgi:YD repeat-containing protein